MMIKAFTPKPETLAYNLRVARMIQLFREIRGLDRKSLYEPLSYTSGGWSMIEAGKRGLNKTKLKKAAAILGTYPEVLTSDVELTKEELINIDRFIYIMKHPTHPLHTALMQITNE